MTFTNNAVQALERANTSLQLASAFVQKYGDKLDGFLFAYSGEAIVFPMNPTEQTRRIAADTFGADGWHRTRCGRKASKIVDGVTVMVEWEDPQTQPQTVTL